MKNRIRTLLVALALAPVANARPSPVEDPLKVVTTLPELADIAREIGGERVDVQSICRGREYIHAVRVKPSHIVALSRADVFLEMGLSMEHAWVPGLLRTARNRKIALGEPGFVNLSEGWEAIEVPETLSRRQGTDLHPEGNPHFNLDPRGGRHIADRVLAGFVAVDPTSKAHYERRHADYAKRLEAAEARWESLRGALAGKRVASYHTDFSYLVAALGLERVATLEPKPGVPPTPRHLATVIQTMREKEVSVLLTASWSNNKQVEEVARRTDAEVVELPHMVGSVKGADSWIAMMDLCHERLAKAFGVEYPPE